MKSTRISLPNQYVEVNEQDLDQIVGGGWVKEGSSLAGALCGSILEGLKGKKDFGPLGFFAGAVTGFMKWFCDGRKFGGDMEESITEITEIVG